MAGLPCLVVGGGPVGARKAAGLVDGGATVTVVAPDLCPAAERLVDRGSVRLERRPYVSGEAAGYRLVVAATGAASVDRQVSQDAAAAGAWVNEAGDGTGSSYTVPAVFRDGPVTVAVSSAGASPALSSWLRDRLATAAGEGLGTLAELLAEARLRCAAGGRATTTVDWRALLDGPLPGLVAAGRVDEARELLRRTVG